MTEKTDMFEVELAKLAAAVVQKATLETTPFDESVDAFKALTAYYALRLKHKTGDDDENNDGFSFGNASFNTVEPPNGSQTVRNRPRRSTS